MDVAPTRLYLVRHGATAANEQVPFVLQGDGLDLPLSPAGEQQAQEAGRHLRGLPIAACYSSPMWRARQTAAVIAETFSLPIQTVPGLQECNVGLWQGLDWQTISQRYPLEYAAFRADPVQVPMLQGESLGQMRARILPAVEPLLTRHAGESIVIVAHKLTLAVLISCLANRELHLAGQIAIPNCSIHLAERLGPAESVVSPAWDVRPWNAEDSAR